MRKRLFSGIIVLTAVMMLTLTGCPNDSSTSVPDPFESIPGTPTKIVATATSQTTIIISWKEVPGALQYNVFRASSSVSGNETRIATVVPADTGVPSCLATGMIADRTYYFRVSAINSVGESAPSASVAATTWPNLPDAPTSVTAYGASTSSVSVSWSYASRATGYYVYYSTYADDTDYTFAGSTTGTSYTVTGLSSGTTYYFKVSAYNSAGEGPLSAYASAMTQSITPNVPTGLNAYAESSTSITVTWNPVSGAQYYYVYYSINDYNFTYVTAYSTSCTVTGLSAGTTYYFRVSAIAYNGVESPQSYSVSATATGGAPTNVNAYAASSSSIIVVWSYVSGASGFYVDRDLDSSNYYRAGPFMQISDGIQWYIDTGLSPNTNYSYRVITYYSNGGESPSPVIVYATTLPSGSGTDNDPIPLNGNAVWNIGAIISIGSAVWYSFPVSNGATYYVWWNDTDNQLGTVDVKVAAYYSDGTQAFTEADQYGTSFTANSDGTVKVRVSPLNDSAGTGIFSITYTVNEPSRPEFSYYY